MTVTPRPLEPDATIGILGGGQLGRMLALAAARLGFKCHVLCPEPLSCAFDVVRRVTEADYTDKAALDRFADDVDLITYEFENVLATTQDRLVEKNYLAALGIPTAPFAAVDSPKALARALKELGRPAVLKSRRFGYDGKGQATIRAGDDPDAAWRGIGAQLAILEAYVAYEREISVVVARGLDGKTACFDVVENEHRDHILKISRVPAAISHALAEEARRIAGGIADAFAYTGVLAVEMFVVADGKGPAVLVNEIAPRVHNSGHWTIDGCSVSQFEQHIRAVAGWPLANPARRGRAEMINLIGAEVEEFRKWLAVPGASVHLYGKSSVRPGRKMGHVTRIFAD